MALAATGRDLTTHPAASSHVASHDASLVLAPTPVGFQHGGQDQPLRVESTDLGDSGLSLVLFQFFACFVVQSQTASCLNILFFLRQGHVFDKEQGNEHWDLKARRNDGHD